MKNFIWGVVVGVVLTTVVLSNVDIEEPVDKIPVNQQRIIYL